MSELLVEKKSVVVPGEVLAKGMDYLPGTGTYRRGEEIIASNVGLVNTEGKVIKLIFLGGGYAPKVGDVIIAKVSDIVMSGWLMKTNTPYTAMLNVKDATSHFIAKGEDLTKIYTFGDYLVTKIYNVTSQKLIDLSMRGPGLKKLEGGQVIEVSASKVPRIVGKAGSMVSMIKKSTNCRIVVGQNGYVWISGSPQAEVIAVNTIRMIEEQAHVSGLTERVQSYLEKVTKGVDLGEPLPEEEHEPQYERRERRFDGPRRDSRRRFDGPRRDSRGPRRDSRGPRRTFNNNRSDN